MIVIFLKKERAGAPGTMPWVNTYYKAYSKFINLIRGENFMLTEADAFRRDGFLTIVLLGQLPTPCDEVVELGHYPANEMGSARIFLREGRKPGMENMYCIQGLGKIWSINRVMLDQYAQTVEIFINGQLVRKIQVIDFTANGFHNLH